LAGEGGFGICWLDRLSTVIGRLIVAVGDQVVDVGVGDMVVCV
jgi:hypothetical protein